MTTAAGQDGPVFRVGGQTRAAFPIVVACLAVAATLPALLNGWTLDAEVDILANRFVRGPLGPGLLTSDYTAGANLASGFWRPVVLVAYWLLWRMGLGTPLAFYVANIALHAAVSVGVYRLARRLGGTAAIAAAGAALFAVHPVHCDVTAGVVGLKDLLAAGGFVGGLLFLLDARHESGRRRISLTFGGLGLFLGGVLSKESALALVPAVVLVDAAAWLTRDRKAPRFGSSPLVLAQYAGIAAVLAFKFGLQTLLLGGTTEIIAADPADNPFVLLPAAARPVHALGLVPHYARLLFWPVRLSPDYSYDAIPVAPGTFPAASALGAGILLLLLFIAARAIFRREKLLLSSLALFAAAYLPISNLVVTLGTNMAERFLYLPSVGFCLALGWLLTRPRLPSRVALGLVAALALAGLVRSDLRCLDWRDRYTLWSTAHEVVPRNLKVTLNLALQLSRKGEPARAVALLREALEQRDDSPVTRPIREGYRPVLQAALGSALTDAGQLEEARSVLALAVRDGGDLPDPWIRRARLENRLGEPAAALADLDAARRLNPTGAEVVRISEERQFALAMLERSAAAAESPAAARGRRLYRQGDLDGAVAAFREAADREALVDLGVLLSVRGPLPEAEQVFRSLIAKEPGRPLYLYNLGLVLQRTGRLDEAGDAFRAALAGTPLSPALRDAVHASLDTLPAR